MDEQTARRFIDEARFRQERAGDNLMSFFWWGYIYGVRRAWHGEGFDDEKHKYLINFPEEHSGVVSEILRARGYKAGFAEKTPAEAIWEAKYV